MTVLEQLSACLETGGDAETARLARQAVAEGYAPQTILDDGLITGMTRVGEKFRNHEIFLPHVLLAARAMYAGLDVLKPLLQDGAGSGKGTIILGTVKGDLHDLGKNLVGIMLRGSGYEVIDLGKDVPPEKFISAAVESEASVIGMSALLTTTMPVMADVTRLLNEKGLHDRIKTIVGGAPLSDETARELGADAYAYDATSAVDKIGALISQV